MVYEKNYRALKNSAQANTSNQVANTMVVASEEAPLEKTKRIFVVDPNAEYVPYTQAQINRRMELLQFYSDENCDMIMANIEPYGQNTFNNIMHKVGIIADEDSSNSYYDELASFVSVGEVITLGDIVGIVREVRSEHGLSRIKENLVNTCVTDLFKFFTIKAVYSNKLYLKSTKKVLDGYIAIFNLNCQISAS